MKIETFGDAPLQLAALASRGEDLPPLMDRIGAALASLTKLLFTSSRSPYGVRWAALKLRQGQPLRDKGALMNSITWVPESRSVVIGPGFGPSSKGAATQQFGATIVPKNGSVLRFKVGNRWFSLRKAVIPARPYLPTRAGGLPDSWEESIVRETGIWLMGNA